MANSHFACPWFQARRRPPGLWISRSWPQDLVHQISGPCPNLIPLQCQCLSLSLFIYYSLSPGLITTLAATCDEFFEELPLMNMGVSYVRCWWYQAPAGRITFDMVFRVGDHQVAGNQDPACYGTHALTTPAPKADIRHKMAIHEEKSIWA